MFLYSCDKAEKSRLASPIIQKMMPRILFVSRDERHRHLSLS